jgi:hypothetical protein
MRVFACYVVSKLQRHRCPTFGALLPRNRHGQTGRYIFIYIDINERCDKILGTSHTFQGKRKYPYQQVSGNILFKIYRWRSATFVLSAGNVLHENNARLDTSHHWPSHSFRDGGAVADSLTCVHNAMKCLIVINRSCINNRVLMPPEVKIQKVQVWGAWRPHSGISSAYPLVMIWRPSRTARLKCALAPSCTYSIPSAVTYNLNVSELKLIWTFFWLRMCISCQKFDPAFQQHFVGINPHPARN